MSIDKDIRILVVDDHKTMLRILLNLLRRLGFNNVDAETDGDAALRKIRERAYSLIISDWNMEPMNGLELLREVRSDERIKGTPFTMVTANSKVESVTAAKQAGVSNYIVKPFGTDTLRKKMVAVIGDF